MFVGLDELFSYSVSFFEETNSKWPAPLVVYWHMGDAIHRAAHALQHYFCIDLREDYLQNSSIGTPYQKWAYFTNMDFEAFDQSIRRLSYSIDQFYLLRFTEPEAIGLTRSAFPVHANPKSALNWFETVGAHYASLRINPDCPVVTLMSISLKDRLLVGTTDFEREKTMRPPPSPFSTETVPIEDRSTLTRLQRDGEQALVELRRFHKVLGDFVMRNLRVSDLVRPVEFTILSHPEL